DVLSSIINNTGEEWILNVPNKGSLDFLASDRIVELPCRVDARGAMPFTQADGGLRLDQRGLLSQLAEYEGATAQVALWGTRRDAIKALAANPLVLSYSKAEQVYDEMAAAHKQYLPERLLYLLNGRYPSQPSQHMVSSTRKHSSASVILLLWYRDTKGHNHEHHRTSSKRSVSFFSLQTYVRGT